MNIFSTSAVKQLRLAIIGITALCAPLGAQAAVKIGFITTLTTPAGVIGEDIVNSVNLAMQHIDRKMNGIDVELFIEDDGFKPDIGKQKTDKLIKQNKVDFVAGYIWSHVLLASMKSVFDADKFLISANAGPSKLAGARCNANFFSTSWQNDQPAMALGEYLNHERIESVYIMAPNYAAGKDMVAGFSSTFAGQIKGRDLTKWGADAQLDFSAELAKANASGAQAFYIFYPGKAGGAFIKQYQQAGLRFTMPLYSVFTVDAIALPKLQQANLAGVLGSKSTLQWSPDIDNAANRRFVGDYLKAHDKYPSFYGAQAYDAIMLIKSAVESVDGDLTQQDALRRAFKAAKYDSVRGDYTVGDNHMPIQNFYLREVVTDSAGRWTTKIVDTVYKNHRDPYAAQCKM